jgi:prepilin-type processing-associated H-X9-DG protein
MSNGTSQVVIGWEHNNGPVCFEDAPHDRWPIPFTPNLAPIHYPARHDGLCHCLFCDGHVAGLRLSDLKKNMFYDSEVAE